MTTFAFAPSTTTTTSSDPAGARVGWARGLATGLVAAVVVTAVAAVFDVAGYPLSVVDGAVPVLSFGQLVLMATVVGILIARHTSRTAFLRTASVLTALSCVPDLVWGATVADAAGLVLTHLIAAAIIVPRLARR